MQYFRPPAGKTTSQQLLAKGQQLLKTRQPRALATLLLAEEAWLKDMAANPLYHTFQVPKPNGAMRLIENPHQKLKEWQRNFAAFLQGVYWPLKPPAAYAFVPTVADDLNPRNIFTNASRHCEGKWVLQIDLKDFFHYISAQQVQQIFREMPFDFPDETASLLARLTTYKGRLPMGAPTSPVLSNFVAIELDHSLERIARNLDMTYTRYADDLTFSGQKRPRNDEVEHIRQTIESHGFHLNFEKNTLRHIDERPEVCGLELRPGKPDLSARFVRAIKTDIKTYRNLLSSRHLLDEIFSPDALARFRQHIEGQMAFVRFIKGPNHKLALQMRSMMAEDIFSSAD